MRRSFVIHSLAQAREAMEAARRSGDPVTLESPPGAAGFQGIGWWREVIRAVTAEFPHVEFDAVLDCGSAAGYAVEALRTGSGTVRLEASDDIMERVSGIAQACGGTVLKHLRALG